MHEKFRGAQVPNNLIPSSDFSKKMSILRLASYAAFAVLCHVNSLRHGSCLVCNFVALGSRGIKSAVRKIDLANGGITSLGLQTLSCTNDYGSKKGVFVAPKLSKEEKNKILDGTAVAAIRGLPPFYFAEYDEMVVLGASIFEAVERTAFTGSINVKYIITKRK